MDFCFSEPSLSRYARNLIWWNALDKMRMTWLSKCFWNQLMQHISWAVVKLQTVNNLNNFGKIFIYHVIYLVFLKNYFVTLWFKYVISWRQMHSTSGKGIIAYYSRTLWWRHYFYVYTLILICVITSVKKYIAQHVSV